MKFAGNHSRDNSENNFSEINSDNLSKRRSIASLCADDLFVISTTIEEEENIHKNKKKRDLNQNRISTDEELGAELSDYESVDERKPCFSLRWSLVLISFATYCIQFFIRNSFAVAIVAMVNSTTDSSEEFEDSKDVCAAANNTKDDITEESDGEFQWDATEQGVILSAYFWGNILAKLFLSRLGETIGQREIIAFGNVVAGLLVLLSPLAASLSPYALAALRFLIGACYGPISSSYQSLLSAWAPRSELASMVSAVFSGATLGGMVGLFSAGWLTDQFGWRIVFWLGGVLAFVTPPIWIICVRNSPSEHPWLSNYERKELEGIRHVKKQKSVPWKKVLLSPYVHICSFALFARTWLDTLFATEGPSFFRYKLGLDLNTSSYVAGAYYLSAVIAILSFGRIADFIINNGWLSKIHTRKLFHIIGTGGATLVLVSIALADCNTTVVIILWVVMGGIASATISSFNVSVIDFAPNYTGTVTGILGLGNIGGAMAPSVTSALLQKGNGWNDSFYLSAGLCIVSLVLYVSFMTAEPQSWNYSEDEKSKEVESTEYKTYL